MSITILNGEKVVNEWWFDIGHDGTIEYLNKVAQLVSEGYEIIDQGYGYTSFKTM